MSRRLNPEDDPFDTLSDDQHVHEEYVAGLLQCSTRWLQQQRERREPPPCVYVSRDMVRYRAGSLRQWMASLSEETAARPSPPLQSTDPNLLRGEIESLQVPVLKGGRRRSRLTSFQSFLIEGRSNDEWLFGFVGDERRPVDVFLAIIADLPPTASCEWLTLDQYLVRLKSAADFVLQREEATRSAIALADLLPPAPHAHHPRLGEEDN
jgi:hypothetical protein